MPTSYSSRSTVSTNYTNTGRISAYYLIDEENNFITDEEGNYILIIGEGSDGLPISDYNGRTTVSTNYSNRNPI